jgi:formylglycine-generating enzyme required for sulfatase activity
MAPELWRGQAATPRTDVYALGALLYELCCGHPPHQARRLVDLAQEVLNTEAAPLGASFSDPELAALIEGCLQRDPAARPASAEGVLAALHAPAPAPPPRRARRLLRAAAVALILLGLSAGGVWLRARAPRRMVRLPGGTFTMGSDPREIAASFAFCQRLGIPCAKEVYEREGPQRQVTVSPFRLDRTEVTNRQFASWLARNRRARIERGRLVMEDGVLLADVYPGTEYSGLQHRDGRIEVRRGFAERPVVQVTWDGAARYCRDQGQRLPTEAEWELAARGTEGARHPWGDEPPRCDGVVFDRRAQKTCAGLPPGPADVATAPQDLSPLGVHDLGGNVAEWVEDAFLPRYPGCPPPCLDPLVRAAPHGEGDAALRVVRGGAWYRAAEACRAAGRARARRDQVQGDIGFRCAASAR